MISLYFLLIICRPFATAQEFPAKDILKDASQLTPPETNKIDAALDVANWSVKKYGRVTLKHIQSIIQSMKSGLVIADYLCLSSDYSLCLESNRSNLSSAEFTFHPLPWKSFSGRITFSSHSISSSTLADARRIESSSRLELL